MQNLILLPLYKNYRILFGWFCEVYHVVKCKLNMRLLCSVLFESCMTVFMATWRHSECLILMYPVAIVFETPLDSVCLILVEGSGENYFIFLVMFCMHDGPPPLSYHIGQGVLEPGCMDKYLIGTCVGVLTGYQGFCEGSYSVVIIYVWIKMIIIIFMLILKLMLLVLGFVMVHCNLTTWSNVQKCLFWFRKWQGFSGFLGMAKMANLSVINGKDFREWIYLTCYLFIRIVK